MHFNQQVTEASLKNTQQHSLNLSLNRDSKEDIQVINYL